MNATLDRQYQINKVISSSSIILSSTITRGKLRSSEKPRTEPISAGQQDAEDTYGNTFIVKGIEYQSSKLKVLLGHLLISWLKFFFLSPLYYTLIKTLPTHTHVEFTKRMRTLGNIFFF